MYTVYKGSKEYARITEPLPILKLQKNIFRFNESHSPKVFDITKKGGIIYIKNANLLKQINQSQIT